MVSSWWTKTLRGCSGKTDVSFFLVVEWLPQSLYFSHPMSSVSFPWNVPHVSPNVANHPHVGLWHPRCFCSRFQHPGWNYVCLFEGFYTFAQHICTKKCFWKSSEVKISTIILCFWIKVYFNKLYLAFLSSMEAFKCEWRLNNVIIKGYFPLFQLWFAIFSASTCSLYLHQTPVFIYCLRNFKKKFWCSSKSKRYLRHKRDFPRFL